MVVLLMACCTCTVLSEL